MPEGGVRKTFRASKSRGGCTRCKAKHTKCDEGKPGCNVCRTSGVDCPGYSKPLRWSTKHERFAGPEPPRSAQNPVARDESPRPSASEQQSGVQEAANHWLRPTSATSSPASWYDPFASQGDAPTQDDAWNATTTPFSAPFPHFEAYGFDDLTLSNLQMGMPFFSPELSLAGGISETNELPRLTRIHTDSSRPLTSPRQSVTAANDPSPHLNDRRWQTDGDGEQESTSAHSPSAGYLQTFYRLSSPRAAPRFTDEDLIGYYFDNVCALTSCFDSDLNPFRLMVANRYTSSTTINYIIQSQAVSHVTNHYPYLVPLGLAKRSQAWRALQKDLQLWRAGKQTTEDILLSLLLMGLSSCWNSASGLGVQYLSIARNIMQRQLQESQSSKTQDEFFQNAILYWEMLASFVDPVPFTALTGPGHREEILASARSSGRRNVFPHPLTGVTPEVHFALAEIGRLVRRPRPTAKPRSTEEDRRLQTLLKADLSWAGNLEEFLHEIDIPGPDQIQEYGDAKTPKDDLIRMAAAYRCIGLLEIYRQYPGVLETRAQSAQGFSRLPFQLPTDYGEYADPNDSLITALAVRTVDVVAPIAISSGSCRLLPMVLLCCGAQLRLPDSPSDANEQHEEVVRVRHMVEARLLVLSRRYPQKPLLVIIDVVKEVWQRLDNDAPNAHWVDVVHEKGWQTIIG